MPLSMMLVTVNVQCHRSVGSLVVANDGILLLIFHLLVGMLFKDMLAFIYCLVTR